MNQVTPEGTVPNGSTELTLDSEEVRRKGRETRDLRILPAGHPTQKWGVVSLVWELGRGAWEGIALSLPQDTAGRAALEGRQNGGGWRARLVLALLHFLPPFPSHPPRLVAFSAHRAGMGQKPLLTARRATSPQGTLVQTRK